MTDEHYRLADQLIESLQEVGECIMPTERNRMTIAIAIREAEQRGRKEAARVHPSQVLWLGRVHNVRYWTDDPAGDDTWTKLVANPGEVVIVLAAAEAAKEKP